MILTFNETGDWAALRAAENWCKENNVSIGTMQAGSPRGLMRGDYQIAKWRNLDNSDKKSLDGQMTGDMRHGPITIEMRE